MLEGLSPLHLVLALAIAMIVLGPAKLPELGAAFGKTIREFKRAAGDLNEPVTSSITSLGVPGAAPTLAAEEPSEADQS